MKLRILLVAIATFIVLGFAQKPASVQAQSTTGCENAPTQYLNYRSELVTLVRVAETDNRSNRLRVNHNISSHVTLMMPVGDWLLITGNPVCEDGYRWWPVAIDKNGQTYNGWTADGEGNIQWLELVSVTDPRPIASAYALTATASTATTTPTPHGSGSVTPTATPRATTTPAPIATGTLCSLAPTFRDLYVNNAVTEVRVTDVNSLPNNLRQSPSLNSTVLTQVAVGQTLLVTGEPRCIDGYRFWPVTYQPATGATQRGWMGDGIRENGQNVYYLERTTVAAGHA